MNDILNFLSQLKDPIMGLVIVGMFYMLWMKEKTCQAFSVSYKELAESTVRAVTLLEVLVGVKKL